MNDDIRALRDLFQGDEMILSLIDSENWHGIESTLLTFSASYSTSQIAGWEQFKTTHLSARV